MRRGRRGEGAARSVSDEANNASVIALFIFYYSSIVPRRRSFEGKDRWNEGRGERLFNFKVNDEDNDDLMLWGGEIVTLDGDVIGELTSGTFSPTMNANIGMGLLKHDEVYSKGWIKAMSDAGRLRLLVGERDVGVEAKLGCWYDPKGEKIKGL